MCRNGHSLLLHSPAKGKTPLKQQSANNRANLCDILMSESTHQTWSRSSIQASSSCRIRGGTRTDLPSYKVPWASAYRPPSSLRWCGEKDTSHLAGGPRHRFTLACRSESVGTWAFQVIVNKCLHSDQRYFIQLLILPGTKYVAEIKYKFKVILFQSKSVFLMFINENTFTVETVDELSQISQINE